MDQQGSVWCWGENSQGQLGDGTLLARKRPVRVTGLHSVIDLALGGRHTCALLRNGGVECWGANDTGQIGIGKLPYDGHDPQEEAKNPMERTRPARVVELPASSAIAVTDKQSCALSRDGDVYCWGAVEADNLGVPPGGYRPAPVQIVGLAKIRQLVSNGSLTCVLADAGDTWCWGAAPRNEFTEGFFSPRPARVDWRR